MKRIIFKGCGTAIITPFTENGVNYEEFRKMIEFQIKEGADSIIVCGTTGESSTMTLEEKKETIFTPKRTVKYFIVDFLVLFIACMIFWPLIDMLFDGIAGNSYPGWNPTDGILQPAVFAVIATCIEFIFWNFFHKKR